MGINISSYLEKILERDEPMKAYVAEISKVPPMDAEEEARVFAAAAKGDSSAKERITESRLMTVVNIAARYVGRGILFIDLVESGNRALIKAVDSFDFSSGANFTNHLSRYIKNGLTDHIASFRPARSIPLADFERMVGLEKRYVALCAETGEEPAPEIAAEKLGVSVVELQNALHLHELLIEKENAEPLPEPEIDPEEVRALVAEHAETLSERERLVLERRFGLKGCEMQSREELARSFNVTVNRIKQIELKALRKIRGCRSERRSPKLRDYLEQEQ